MQEVSWRELGHVPPILVSKSFSSPQEPPDSWFSAESIKEWSIPSLQLLSYIAPPSIIPKLPQTFSKKSWTLSAMTLLSRKKRHEHRSVSALSHSTLNMRYSRVIPYLHWYFCSVQSPNQPLNHLTSCGFDLPTTSFQLRAASWLPTPLNLCHGTTMSQAHVHSANPTTANILNACQFKKLWSRGDIPGGMTRLLNSLIQGVEDGSALNLTALCWHSKLESFGLPTSNSPFQHFHHHGQTWSWSIKDSDLSSLTHYEWDSLILVWSYS